MWSVVTILDSQGLEDSGYHRSANKCPRSPWYNGWRPKLYVLKGHTPERVLDSIQLAARAVSHIFPFLGVPRPDTPGKMSDL